MGHRGPDQIDSARDYFFNDHDRRNRVRHPGVMFSHFPTLPPYVLRYGLMRTTEQSQSVRQTHSETMRGEGGGGFTFEKLSFAEIPTKLIINRRANKGSGTNISIALLR